MLIFFKVVGELLTVQLLRDALEAEKSKSKEAIVHASRMEERKWELERQLDIVKTKLISVQKTHKIEVLFATFL